MGIFNASSKLKKVKYRVTKQETELRILCKARVFFIVYVLYWCTFQSNNACMVDDSIYEHITLVDIVCHKSFCQRKIC